MALPNPGMDAVPFTPLTAEFLDDIIENIESLSSGTGIGDGSIAASKLDSTTYGTVDANGWKDYGTYFVKSVTFTNTTDLLQFATTIINLSSNFGVPVNGPTPSVSNTTLTDRFISDSSWSVNCIGYAGDAPFAMQYVNARNGNSKIGTRQVTAVVYK